MVIGMGLGTVSWLAGWIGGAAKVVRTEFGPENAFKRYQWFKDVSATLDKNIADIQVYDRRIKNLSADYKGEPRSKWARDDREQHNVWISELAGIKARYNSLASEYNSAMVKINFAFTNLGDLPPGATTALPKAYKPYITD